MIWNLFLLFQGRLLPSYIPGALTFVTSGTHFGWPSPSLLILQNSDNSTISVSSDEGSWITVLPLTGAILGSVLAATIVDILGRKRCIIFTCFPFAIAWIMIAISQELIVLYSARFISGISDGFVYTVVPMYTGEISDPMVRGLLGSGIAASSIFGILLINIVGSYLSISITALVSLVVPIVTLLTSIWMKESPYYLVMRGRHEEAKKNLRILRGKHDVDNELNRLTEAVITQTTNKGNVLDLFTTKSNRKAVYIVIITRGVQQLSGISPITCYSQLIFQEAGNDVSPQVAAIIFFSVQLLLTIVCLSIVDKTGRRPLLIISLIGSAITLCIEGCYFYIQTQTTILDASSFSWLPLVSLIGFVIFFSIGLETIPVLMLGELFPANVKAFALCLADIYFCLMVIVVSKFFQILKDFFGTFLPFYAFTVCCLLGLGFVVLFVPETMGKNLEEIQLLLGGKITREENKNKRETNVVSY